MPILVWHDRVYSLGVGALDRQHRRLVDLINEAHAAAAGGEPTAVAGLAGAMVAYAEEHFADEERLMAEAGYDRLHRHRGDHGAFVDRARAYAAAAQAGNAPDGDEVFRFLASWLSAHILEVDMAFGRFLKHRAAARGGPSPRGEGR